MSTPDTNLSWTDERTPLTDNPVALRMALAQYEEFAQAVAAHISPDLEQNELHYMAANAVFDARQIASGLPQSKRAEMTPPILLGGETI